MPRKGRKAAPAIFATTLKSRGRCAALSRHEAAPTGMANGLDFYLKSHCICVAMLTPLDDLTHTSR